MSEDEVKNSCLAYVIARLEGETERQNAHLKIVRWQTTALLNTIMPKGKKLQVTDLLRLPDDEPASGGAKPITKQAEAEFLISQFNS